jgi:hypothetical protein
MDTDSKEEWKEHHNKRTRKQRKCLSQTEEKKTLPNTKPSPFQTNPPSSNSQKVPWSRNTRLDCRTAEDETEYPSTLINSQAITPKRDNASKNKTNDPTNQLHPGQEPNEEHNVGHNSIGKGMPEHPVTNQHNSGCGRGGDSDASGRGKFTGRGMLPQPTAQRMIQPPIPNLPPKTNNHTFGQIPSVKPDTRNKGLPAISQQDPATIKTTGFPFCAVGKNRDIIDAMRAFISSLHST